MTSDDETVEVVLRLDEWGEPDEVGDVPAGVADQWDARRWTQWRKQA